MHHFLRVAFSLFIVSFILSGCSTQGIAEFGLYTEAFNKQYEQSEMILDSVAFAERAIALRKRTKPGYAHFNPDDSAYYIEGVDPPFTASIRSSVHTLKQYNDVLAALANGEAAAAFSAKVGTLATNITAAASAAATAKFVAVPDVAEVTTVIAGINNKIDPLKGLVTELATIASRDAFQRELLKNAPNMDALLKELRDGTPVLFKILQRGPIQGGSVLTPTGQSTEAQTAEEKNRLLLSAWVLMIDQTRLSMKAAVDALQNRTSEADLAALNDAAVELKIIAEKVRLVRAR